MLGFSPFKKHANKFNYIPRYYDPEKEAREARRAELHGERSDDAEGQQNLSGKASAEYEQVVSVSLRRNACRYLCGKHKNLKSSRLLPGEQAAFSTNIYLCLFKDKQLFNRNFDGS